MSGRKRYIPILPPHPIFTPDYLRHETPTAPPRDDPDATPYRCFHIHVDYIPALIALCDYYCYPDAFLGNETERQEAAARFVNLQIMLMQSNLPCGEGEGMLLRQNLINPCLLEFSNDAGATWALAFDYSICSRRQPHVTVTVGDYNDYRATNTTNMTTYNGDIVNVAPEWDYGDEDDIWRDMAMCWAAERWVELCVAIAIKMGERAVEETQDYLRTASDIASEVSMFLTQLVKMEVYPAASQVGALVFGLASIVLDFISEFQEFDAAVLGNQDAQTQVAC
jgi:hypothetical protein